MVRRAGLSILEIYLLEIAFTAHNWPTNSRYRATEVSRLSRPFLYSLTHLCVLTAASITLLLTLTPTHSE
jgi:hypothetical protein